MKAKQLRTIFILWLIKNDANLRYADLSGADLRYAIVPRAIFDKRGYVLHTQQKEDGALLFVAGCRRFTYEESIAHWGSDSYPDKERGAMWVAHVELYQKLYGGNVKQDTARGAEIFIITCVIET